ncbi:lipase [Paenibacillus rhizosphaerae]|uniref:Lipase n=1 Tax=Paenibacillus rhizosphaerae TaxID=297318 RepID=A0A1R1EFE0_9BACL|nr:alpha/beta hydrolase [Paenibacillus rhizosphaerae]OMF50554.1 lipase [Paenibacillus rhizosphaerae]
MPLDPQVQVVLENMKKQGVPPLHTLSVERARTVNLSSMAAQPEEVWKVDNRKIPGPAGHIPVRVYRPQSKYPLPVLIYYHGGGWVVGDLDAADVLCRQLANGANVIVVSVDYRLAPEHRFPAAIEDAYAAAAWVAENSSSLEADPNRMAVGGDSAGGNLAAAVTLMARDQGLSFIKFQLLFNPATRYAFDTDSYRDNAEGYGLTTDTMRWFWGQYLAEEQDGRNPYASPLLAADFSSLPPALVITAEFDPLRDDGEAYAAKLKAAGTPVEAKRYDGMVHGFMLQTGGYDQGRQAVRHAVSALRKALHGQERGGETAL